MSIFDVNMISMNTMMGSIIFFIIRLLITLDVLTGAFLSLTTVCSVTSTGSCRSSTCSGVSPDFSAKVADMHRDMSSMAPLLLFITFDIAAADFIPATLIISGRSPFSSFSVKPSGMMTRDSASALFSIAE